MDSIVLDMSKSNFDYDMNGISYDDIFNMLPFSSPTPLLSPDIASDGLNMFSMAYSTSSPSHSSDNESSGLSDFSLPPPAVTMPPPSAREPKPKVASSKAGEGTRQKKRRRVVKQDLKTSVHINKKTLVLLSLEEFNERMNELRSARGCDFTAEEQLDIKNMERKIKNRIAAKISRQKKKENGNKEMDSLKKEKENLEKENVSLRARISTLEAENNTLRSALVQRNPAFAAGIGISLLAIFFSVGLFLNNMPANSFIPPAIEAEQHFIVHGPEPQINSIAEEDNDFAPPGFSMGRQLFSLSKSPKCESDDSGKCSPLFDADKSAEESNYNANKNVLIGTAKLVQYPEQQYQSEPSEAVKSSEENQIIISSVVDSEDYPEKQYSRKSKIDFSGFNLVSLQQNSTYLACLDVNPLQAATFLDSSSGFSEGSAVNQFLLSLSFEGEDGQMIDGLSNFGSHVFCHIVRTPATNHIHRGYPALTAVVQWIAFLVVVVVCVLFRTSCTICKFLCS